MVALLHDQYPRLRWVRLKCEAALQLPATKKAILMLENTRKKKNEEITSNVSFN